MKMNLLFYRGKNEYDGLNRFHKHPHLASERKDIHPFVGYRAIMRLSTAGLLCGFSSLALAHHHDRLEITKPEQAREKGLESLRLAVRQDGGVPLPERLDEFVKDRKAAIELGKTFFWDMQVGSDGVQACASCHFHAGTDDRTRNAINPNNATLTNQRQDDIVGYSTATGLVPAPIYEIHPANGTLVREDFPFVKYIQALQLNPDGSVLPGVGNSNDIAGSMGVLFNRFDGVQPGLPIDLGVSLPDPVFNIDSTQNVRRIESRNTPSMINAVFNFTNFWEGRGNNHFNGQNAFGDHDANAAIVVNHPGTGPALEKISLANASLASQALNPPSSSIEMAFGDPAQANGRSLFDLGKKLFRPAEQTGKPVVPLGQQEVHRHDSVLGHLSKSPERGLTGTYADMVKRAFRQEYWDLDRPLSSGITQMEANFGLFFGLSVALYESSLVSDQTAFDRWMESGRFSRNFGYTELAGLNLFVNEGQCISCHTGPEFTDATVRRSKGGKQTIAARQFDGAGALYDVGFHNIGVTPTTDDIGRGGADPFSGEPLAFARQALFDRLSLFAGLGLPPITFPIIGNDAIPARSDGSESAVCDDRNGDGVCGVEEPITSKFKRVAVDGAFKTPGLRNAELTGPYFHNGGAATLRQAVQFFNRGGNFCDFNAKDLAPGIEPLNLTQKQERQLVAFILALTDLRVKYQSAPFDHPELRIPADGTDTVGRRVIPAVGESGDWRGLRTFLNLDPLDPIYTPKGICRVREN